MAKKLKIDLLMETFLKESPTTLFEPTKEGVSAFAQEIKAGIEGLVPLVQTTTGMLNQFDYLYVRVILQPKEKWANNIIDNAASMTFLLDADGKISMPRDHLYVKSKRPHYALDRLPVKFVKQPVKNAAQAVAKIKAMIDKARAAYAEAGEPLEENKTRSLSEAPKAEANLAGTLRFLWNASASGDSATVSKIIDKKFGGELPPQLQQLLTNTKSAEDFARQGVQYVTPSEISINSNNMVWRVAKIDSTHLKMTTSETSWSGAAVYHIEQIRNQPFYNDLKSWLKGDGNPDGKIY
jgi:hypothetical protein